MTSAMRLLLCCAILIALPLNAAAQREEEQQGTRDTSAAGERLRLETDISYAGTHNERQRLDLILPKQPADAPLPVIAFIHGGGWRGGDKRAGLARLKPLAETGKFACVSIGYRLSGEAKWPAQVHDCKAAIRWIRANAERYHLDADRIGLMGTSAGGHLVALLGTSGDSAALEGDLGEHDGLPTHVRCVVDFYGPADLRTVGQRSGNADSAVSQLLGGTVEEKADAARAASPIEYVSPGDPPFLILHGTEDRVVPIEQSENFAAALAEADVPVVFVKVTGGGHSFQNPEIQERMLAFFGNHLLGEQNDISGEPLPALPN